MYTTNETQNMLPPQAPPIDRTPSGMAAFASGASVEASVFGLPSFVTDFLL